MERINTEDLCPTQSSREYFMGLKSPNVVLGLVKAENYFRSTDLEIEILNQAIDLNKKLSKITTLMSDEGRQTLIAAEVKQTNFFFEIFFFQITFFYD